MKILEFYILDAIAGDVQKVYSEATNEEQEMKQPTPHKHAAMIKEWVSDTSRVIEVRYAGNFLWHEENTFPLWSKRHDYRFADDVTPVKPEIVSSLSDDELRNFGRLVKSGENQWRRIADFAAKKAHAEGYQAAIDAVIAMPSKSTLSQCNFDLLRQANPFEGTWNNANRFAAESIAKFQADVKKYLTKRVKELGGEVRKAEWVGHVGELVEVVNSYEAADEILK